jgi:plastocyanin
MRRGGSLVVLAALGVAGLAAGIFVAGGGASSEGSHATAHSTATTHVTVTATDSKFKLSRRSAPKGTVIFTVTNKGKVPHDFKIAGKKTPLLSPGHSATLRVTFSKKGRYPYLSTVSGQASHGMKGGVFSVAAAVAPTPTPTTTAPAPPPPTTVGTASTTVTVDMYDDLGQFRFVLSQKTIPSGMVTFVITNKCVLACSFDLEGIKAGAILNKVGQSETWTVALAPGIYRYHCDVDSGMKGSFTVTS